MQVEIAIQVLSRNRLSSVRLLTACLPAGSAGLFCHTLQQVFAQVKAFRLQTLRLQKAANDIPTGSKPLFIFHLFNAAVL